MGVVIMVPEKLRPICIRRGRGITGGLCTLHDNTIDMTFEPGHNVTFELTIYGVAL